MQHLKDIVPKKKVVFLDVKDGWEPLCKALNCEVPQDIPFPWMNDSTAIDNFAKELIVKGILRWTAIIGLLAGYIGIWFKYNSTTESRHGWQS